MKATRIPWLTLTIALALVLTACAGPATVAPPEAPPEAPPDAPMGTIDCKGASAGDSLTVMYQWSGAEEEKINTIFAPLVEECGISISAESTRDVAVLDARVQSDPPDLLFWPSTAPLTLYPDLLIPLDQVGGQADSYAGFWVDLGSAGGSWLAVPVKADIKTIVWYSPAQFEAFGYAVPTTFAELEALVDQMVADGNVPWSMGFESGPATGWTGSDFIQDLLLTQQGPEYVMNLISGEVAYNDAGVMQAYETYLAWATDPTTTVGGADGTLTTPFLDAIYKIVSDPVEAMMVKQSGFAGGEIVAQFPDLTYGTDFDFFAFPGAQGMQGGADFMMAFGDSPAAQAMVGYLTSAAGGAAWAEAGFDLSPNSGADGHYMDPQLAKKGAALTGASGFTPDLGDSIPAPFGETEFSAIADAVGGGDLATALGKAAEAQAEALGQ